MARTRHAGERLESVALAVTREYLFASWKHRDPLWTIFGAVLRFSSGEVVFVSGGPRRDGSAYGLTLESAEPFQCPSLRLARASGSLVWRAVVGSRLVSPTGAVSRGPCRRVSR